MTRHIVRFLGWCVLALAAKLAANALFPVRKPFENAVLYAFVMASVMTLIDVWRDRRRAPAVMESPEGPTDGPTKR